MDAAGDETGHSTLSIYVHPLINMYDCVSDLPAKHTGPVAAVTLGVRLLSISFFHSG